MPKLTKYFNRKLKQELKNRVLTPERIAAVMASILSRDDFKKGFRIPTQMKVHTLLSGSTIPMIQQTWLLLIREYCLIEPRRGIGTFLILNLSAAQIETNAELIWRSTYSDYQMLLDRETLPGFNDLFEEKVSRAQEIHVALPSPVLHQKVHPGLTEELAELIRSIMNFKFEKSEVLYTEFYLELITFLFEVNCKAGFTAVVITTVSAVVKEAMKKSNRDLEFVGTDIYAQAFLKLESICAERAVGVVYIGPTAPFPVTHVPDAECWEFLFRLKRERGFKIILDVMLPGLVYFPPLFAHMGESRNTSICVIMKVTSHYNFAGVTAVAGPATVIDRLKMKYYKRDRMLSFSLSTTLYHLLKHDDLRLNELQAYQQMNIFRKEAVKILLAPDIFVAEHIINQQGWHFYLELKDGSFPPKVYEKHYRNNLYIMHPDFQAEHAEFSTGLIISIAHYRSMSIMTNDLGKFIQETIRTKI